MEAARCQEIGGAWSKQWWLRYSFLVDGIQEAMSVLIGAHFMSMCVKPLRDFRSILPSLVPRSSYLLSKVWSWRSHGKHDRRDFSSLKNLSKFARERAFFRDLVGKEGILVQEHHTGIRYVIFYPCGKVADNVSSPW